MNNLERAVELTTALMILRRYTTAEERAKHLICLESIADLMIEISKIQDRQ